MLKKNDELTDVSSKTESPIPDKSLFYQTLFISNICGEESRIFD
jgi:hypothetical protein